jgi:hypothetical protein
MNTTPTTTRTVTFTYGTAKDAALKVPVGPTNLYTIASLIRESYLDWMFDRPVMMSDEVLMSCIGKNNFFAGALGGWQTRLNPKDFAALKELAEDDDVAMALAIVRRRNPGITAAGAYRQAATIRNLSPSLRESFLALADRPAVLAL